MQVNVKERDFFLSNKKEERKKEKIQRRRMTSTSWSVVCYVVHGEVGKCIEEKKWINVMYII